jgi:hypothetical protein
VVVAFLLGGAAWYASLHSARRVVGILQRTQRLWVIFVFVDTSVSILFSFLSLFFSFGLDCAVCPSSDLVVSCGYYINIAERKPVLRSIINPHLTQPDGLGDILHRSVLGK